MDFSAQEMNRKQAEALQKATEAQSDLKRKLETRDLVQDSGSQATKARIQLLEESVDRLQTEK
jgi:polyhydroxyalkanoate synthesis regulator phasin